MLVRNLFVAIACSVIAIGVGSARIAEARPVGKPAIAAERAKTAASGKAAQLNRALGKAVRFAPVARKVEPQVRRGRGATRVSYRAVERHRPSIGQVIGLHRVDDPLDLHSAVAMVIDQASNGILFEKNPGAVLPIASITKLMTAMVVLDAGLPMGEPLDISEADIDLEKFSSSRLRPGSRLTRGEMMHLALMASENRAASALGRHYPGGLTAFVAAMNDKAHSLGMRESLFVDPTGLSSRNVSNARDLAKMVRAATDYPMIRQYSTASELTVDTGLRLVSFRSTNRLIDSPSWDIGLQKTGYINEAGNCLVMQATIEGRPVIMVLLDAAGRASRFADAGRLKDWLETGSGVAEPPSVLRTSGHVRAIRGRAALGS